MNKLHQAFCAVLLAGTALAGCSHEPKTVSSRNLYPIFYSPDLRQVAVVPFQTEDCKDADTGELVAKRLAAELTRNGTYRVIGPQQLSRDLPPQATYELSGRRLDTVAQTLQQANLPIQAFIVGQVISCRKGEHPNCGCYEQTCELIVMATMARASDGAIIHTTWAQSAIALELPAPGESNLAMETALQQVMCKLLLEFSVTRVPVED